MPDNPIREKAGNTTRLRQMLNYLNDNNAVDLTFVSLKDWGMWREEDVQNFKEQYKNINLKLVEKKYKKNWFTYFLLYKIPYLFKANSIDISSFILRKKFAEVANSEKFDFLVISYASWAKIIDKVKGSPYLIIDTHDFLTAQNSHKKNKIGQLFQDEMNILRQFDEIWTYSVEEKYIFEQFTNRKVTLIPVSFPLQFTSQASKKYDVIYVASDNPHNILGINWFLKEVLPLLNGIRIEIIGKIGSAIGDDYPNVNRHGIVDDLDEFYQNAKIAICPMLSGTGIKIKVIEALSYGIPVVTNRRGVDGLTNKNENGCLVSDDPKIFAENILNLLRDDVLYHEVKNTAISYFEKNHNPLLEIEILNSTFK